MNKENVMTATVVRNSFETPQAKEAFGRMSNAVDRSIVDQFKLGDDTVTVVDTAPMRMGDVAMGRRIM